MIQNKRVIPFIAIVFLVGKTIHAAGISPINITLSAGSGTNIISTYKGKTNIVEYKIEDMIGKPPARTWVWMSPVPAYLTRVASQNQPDCALYHQAGSSPDSFSLPPNGLCYFSLQVNGSLVTTPVGTSTTYRPVFSNSGGVTPFVGFQSGFRRQLGIPCIY